MVKFRIEFKRDECIGAGPCAAVAPKFFSISADDGKADLIGGKQEGDLWTLEIDAADEAMAMQSVDVCPVAIITVKKLG